MQWIKFSDNIPDGSPYNLYLVAGNPICGSCNSSYQIKMCTFDTEEGFLFGEYECPIKATHWMPLPELPKE